MHTETIDYQDGGVQLEGFVAWDDSVKGPRPAVLVAHDWTGRRDFAKGKAEEMAKLGYVGFALDMYGKGVFGTDGDVRARSRYLFSAYGRQPRQLASDDATHCSGRALLCARVQSIRNKRHVSEGFSNGGRA